MRPVLPVKQLSWVSTARPPRYSKKCASLASQPSASRCSSVIAMVSTTHTRNADPRHIDALHGTAAPQRLGRPWTDTFQARAGSSRSGERAASVRCAISRRTTGVVGARHHCATDRLRTDRKRARFAVSGAAVVLVRVSDHAQECAGSLLPAQSLVRALRGSCSYNSKKGRVTLVSEARVFA
jgi:hypothetical protein